MMLPFNQIGIRDDILKAIGDLGFEAPTPIQSSIIPLMLETSDDLIGLAQTGTGKTAAFGLPLIQAVDAGGRQTQSLILCPTRELCMQVANDLDAYARYVNRLRIAAVYGGASMEQQIKSLRKGAQIIVATPGRLLDLVRRGKADVTGIRSVVLDEADEMLNMGFQEELNAILDHTPADKRTLLFSATMSASVAAIADTYMRQPKTITIGQRNACAPTVRHEYVVVRAGDRCAALKRLIDIHPDIYAIVFCRTRQETRDLADSLGGQGYPVDALHGDLSQAMRDQVMQRFRSKSLRLLMATDVAARGLDVSGLTHVINYHLPDDPAAYTHRSGRTGRAGNPGVSISIIENREKQRINLIERKLRTRFENCRIPTGKQILEKSLLHLADRLVGVDNSDSLLDDQLEKIAEKLSDFDRKTLIRRFIAVAMDRGRIDSYRHAPDLNVPEKRSKAKPAASTGSRSWEPARFKQLVFNVGKKDGLSPGRLIGEINERINGPRIRFGKITIMKVKSFVEAESRFAALVLTAFENRMINGKPVSITIADRKSGLSQTAFKPSSKPPKQRKHKIRARRSAPAN